MRAAPPLLLRFAIVLSAAVLLSGASLRVGQSVLVVDDDGGPGVDFVQIQDAVQAAVDGDTILVRSGTYEPITITAKALNVVADTGAFVDVLEPFGTTTPLLHVQDLLHDQAVVVRGLRLRMSYLAGAPSAIVLEDALGTIWLEDVQTAPTFLFANRLQSALTARDCVGVTLARCALLAAVSGAGTGGQAPPGVAATRSNLSLLDSTVVGAEGAEDTGFTPAQAGGHGATLDGGTFFAAGCTITGGGGGGARLGRNGADGGDGLALLAGAPVARLLATTLLGGPGGQGNGPGTSGGRDGAPSVLLSGALTNVAGTARSFETTSPVRAGSPLRETFAGEPGDVVVLAYSLAGPLAPAYVPAARGSLVIAPPLIALVKGTLDAAGQLVTLPASTPLAPGAQALPVALQGAMLSATGQGVFLTGPSHLILLDPSF